MPTPERSLQPSLAEVESAIAALLSADTTLSDNVPTIGVFSGDVGEAFDELVRRLPAVWVVTTGGDFEARGPLQFALEGGWTIFVAAKNLRNEQARRVGETGKLGALELAQRVMEVLAIQDMDLEGLHPLCLESFRLAEASEQRDRRLAVYRIDVSATVDLVVVEPDDDLEHLHVDLRLVDNDSPPDLTNTTIDADVDLTGD